MFTRLPLDFRGHCRHANPVKPSRPSRPRKAAFWSLCALLASLSCGQPRAARAADTAPHILVNYTVYSHWLPVMSVASNYELTDTGYGIATSVRSGGLAGLFLRLNIQSRAQGLFNGLLEQPTSYVSGGWSRDADRHTTLSYPDGPPKVDVLTPFEERREPVPEAMRTHAVDTLSALIGMLHQITMTQKCGHTAEIFDGLRLTHMVLRDAAQPEPNNDIKCEFVGQQIAGFIHNSPDTRIRLTYDGAIWFRKIDGFGFVAVRMELNNPKLGYMVIKMDGQPQHAG